MRITRSEVAEKLAAYLHHEMTIEELVDWAELAVMEGDFEEWDSETLRDIVSRLGLADVRAFGLTWEDCEDFLSRLGYAARIELVAA